MRLCEISKLQKNVQNRHVCILYICKNIASVSILWYIPMINVLGLPYTFFNLFELIVTRLFNLTCRLFKEENF